MYGKLFNRLKNGCRSIKDISGSQPVLSQGPVALEKDLNPSTTEEDQAEKLADQISDDKNSAGKIASETMSDQKLFSQGGTKRKSKRLLLTQSNQRLPSASAAPSNGDWLSFIVNAQYQNWLKVNLALRLVCDFVSPVIDDVVKQMHKKIVKTHFSKSTSRKKYNNRQNLQDRKDFTPWIEDVLKWHRQPPSIKQVYRISNVSKWPQKDGAWEIAKVFMSKRYRPPDAGNTVYAYDMVYILNFLQRCRLMEDYVRDFQNVLRLFQFGQETLYQNRLEIENKAMLTSFDVILAFLNDKRLFSYVNEYLEAAKLIKSVEELQLKSYGHITAAKLSLNILRDDAYNGADGRIHPAKERVKMLQKALSDLLSVPLQARKLKEESSSEEEADAEEPPKKRFASDLEENMERIAEKETKIIKQISNFDENRSGNSSEKPSLPKLSCQPARRETTRKKKSFSESEASETSSEEDSDLDDQSIRLTALVQGSVSNHSPKGFQFERLNPQYSISESLVSQNSLEYDWSDSVRSVMKSELPTSNSLVVIPTEIDRSNDTKKTIWCVSETPKPECAKKGKSDFVEPNIFGPKKPKEMTPQPTKGSGGSGTGYSYKKKLQQFLLKQARNPGARFTVETDVNSGKYFCTVSFQSNFVMSSRIMSTSEEEAKNQAALEANRWILGTYRVTNGEAARIWLDNYASQVVGAKPRYTCTKIASSLYRSHIHLLSNKLFRYDNVSVKPRVLLESSCISSNPGVDVDDTVIKTALQEVRLPAEGIYDNRRILNEYCLQNGGTLPVIHTVAIWHPKTCQMSWNCYLKSFVTRSLSQNIERPSDMQKNALTHDGYTITPVSTEFMSVESSQVHKTPHSAEESAASNLLEKLGCPLKLVLELHGSCKRELEQYVYEMDFSAAYHTAKIEISEDSPLYECFVSSKCLYDTKSNFTVRSDDEGQLSEDGACESAAKNALRLLGLET